MLVITENIYENNNSFYVNSKIYYLSTNTVHIHYVTYNLICNCMDIVLYR